MNDYIPSRVLVVSGIPRSGTSLVMQMLGAAGLPVLIDGHRAPDESNPKGYFEYAPVKGLHKDNGFVLGAAGKAVKVVSSLLPYLPSDLLYAVFFVVRDLDEVLMSQDQMTRHKGARPEDLASATDRREALAQHLLDVRDWIMSRHQFETLWLDHGELVRHSMEQAKLISRFLRTPLPTKHMTSVLDCDLYRCRASERCVPSSREEDAGHCH